MQSGCKSLCTHWVAGGSLHHAVCSGALENLQSWLSISNGPPHTPPALHRVPAIFHVHQLSMFESVSVCLLSSSVFFLSAFSPFVFLPSIIFTVIARHSNTRTHFAFIHHTLRSSSSQFAPRNVLYALQITLHPYTLPHVEPTTIQTRLVPSCLLSESPFFILLSFFTPHPPLLPSSSSACRERTRRRRAQQAF